MTFALASSDFGVSSLTINIILVSSLLILLGLPTLFLLKAGEGKSAL